jgi:replicative DNA helicase
MSLTDPSAYRSTDQVGGEWEPPYERAGGGVGLDRLPPQDEAAEQSVLGAMLLSKDAIADVVEVVRGTDFYKPAHETIYDAVIDLYGRGEPADAVTVAAELGRRGEITRVGGAPYLHTLVSSVPIAVNAGYYAEIVREKAILRRLVAAGTRIAQMGYAGEGVVDDVVDAAQQEVYEVTERRSSEDYAPLSEIIHATLDEIEAISNRGGEMTGVPTGFTDLDELTNGLHAGQMVIVAARPAMGKALALETPVPMPDDGWTTMGEVAVGDRVLGSDGAPTTVVAATGVLRGRPCHELTFSDGSTIVADYQHQWVTRCEGEAPTTVTTGQIARTLDRGHTIGLPEGGEVKVEGAVPVPSVPVRCIQVDAEDHLYLAGPTRIPTHNSTLALDLCRAASIHHNLAAAIFSLEMTRSEITMRLLSAEAKIPLNHMRNGHMTEDDWTKLARKMSEINDAPLFIDDSPNLTMMEIRAKARRLKQRHDLRLVVIDYLQLMTSGKKVESRQLEVSEFSRQIKLLAKELEVPVIALSQLNRGPEQRADKRPMLSDLRESGCLTADTRVLRADTNAEVTIGELMASGARDTPVWALDDRLKLVPRTMTHAFPSGVKDVYELTLASGRTIRATANHPFLTYDGWVPLGELVAGSRIGVVRHVPPPLQIQERDDHEVSLLAHLIGDGSFVKGQPIRYSSQDESCLATVASAAWHLFGITAARDEYDAARVISLRLPSPQHLTHGRRNPIAQWLDEMGLFGLRSHEKFVPDWVFSLPKEQVALFLRNLWATDGCVYFRGEGQGRVYYASTSRRLIDDVSRLLLRFNVTCRIGRIAKDGYRANWTLDITGAENQLRFLDDIGVHGARRDKAELLASHLRTVRPTAALDTIPAQVWDRVKDVLRSGQVTRKQLTMAAQYRGAASAMMRSAPPRARLARVAAVLGDVELEVLATNDVFWDRVKEIQHVGSKPVYDATVMGVHNFVANGISTHNSIEQDADMVVLLHRDDAYEKESTRPGEADLIVAKHRNGPTRDIVVAFQGHYSRFVDMAHG